MPQDLRFEDGFPARTVFIVDDHPMVVRSIEAVAAATPGVEVVGTAGSGEEALQLLAAGPEPDLVLLDVFLPGLSGLETAARYRTLAPSGSRVRVVLMSTASLDDLPGDPARNGADGFLAKADLSVDSLLAHLVQR